MAPHALNEIYLLIFRCPTLIIHGKQDEVVPFWHAPRLLAAIPPEYRAHPFYVNDLGHNHIESRERDRYIQVITEFLMKYVPPVGENDGNTTGVLDKLMHKGGKKMETPTFSHNDTVMQEPEYTNIIPEDERATADEAKKNSSTFYINQTWMRHAKVICREVFSDNIICNSALTVVDWSSGGSSRESSGSREGDENNNRGNGRRHSQRGEKHTYDSRDDADEFAPWRNGGERRHNQYRRSQSDAPNNTGAGEIIQIQWSQKKPLMSKYSNKSSSMPVVGNNGGNAMKVKMNSATKRKNGGRGGFLGFRK